MTPVLEGLPRLLAGIQPEGHVTLADHVERVGRMPEPDGVIEAAELSGLTGRGGAAFPSARKLRAVSGRSPRPIVVANGVEGEPASAKDDLLGAAAPHLVLDGASMVAAALRARDVAICVKEGSPAVEAMRAALEERAAAGTDVVRLSLVAAPVGYVVGEESALVHWLNGGEPKPTFVPPRPFERGVHGRPTLVQNFETLAQLALIARFGADWFRAVGTPDDPGSVLVTLSGAVREPGVYELAGGTELAEVLEAADGLSEPARAFLVGGYAGSWIDADGAATLPLGPRTLRSHGGTLGPGIVVALPRTGCGLWESARTARYLASQSAGQCGPCVHGLAAVAGALEELHAGDASAERRIRHWSGQIAGRGACGHPDGVLRFVGSCLEVFHDEIAAHRSGHCPLERGAPATLPIPGPARVAA